MIYLDYAASSPLFPDVLDSVIRNSRNCFGNPGALHRAGADARQILQNSRRTLAQILSVRPEEIIFTSGATEANNWAVKAGCLRPGKRHIVCAATEHPSVLEAVKAMARSGFSVTWLKPDAQGRISPEDAAAAMTSATALLCVQAVNNETGVMQDVAGLAAAARKAGALYLCDSVQSFGHTRQELHKADLITLSAHKLGGPRGVGCLVIRQPHHLPPLIHGGGQEFNLRSGTENIPGIAGFALAAQISARQLDKELPRLQQLTDRLRQGIQEIVPEAEFAGDEAVRHPGIFFCRIPGITGEEMVIRLAEEGICASPGSACGAGNSAPSHVLLAMGYPAKEALEFFRLSPGWNTTPAEIEQVLTVIRQITQHP